MVETEMAGVTDDVKQQTKDLIEALTRRAQAEAESAGTLTRETYLNAVRRAREAIEGEKLMFARSPGTLLDYNSTGS